MIKIIILTRCLQSTVLEADDIICQVNNVTSYDSSCSGLAGKGDIYVYTHSNNRPDVNFAVSVTFDLATGVSIYKGRIMNSR